MQSGAGEGLYFKLQVQNWFSFYSADCFNSTKKLTCNIELQPSAVWKHKNSKSMDLIQFSTYPFLFRDGNSIYFHYNNLDCGLDMKIAIF